MTHTVDRLSTCFGHNVARAWSTITIWIVDRTDHSPIANDRGCLQIVARDTLAPHGQKSISLCGKSSSSQYLNHIHKCDVTFKQSSIHFGHVSGHEAGSFI